MNEWRFEHDGKQSMRFTPAMVCDDGALLRQWVLADAGIASKSWWDVKRDVEQGRLQLLFAESFIGFSRLDKKCRAAICLSAATAAAAAGYRLHPVLYRLAGK
jgi:DNA-binding transcriptional LysR family regulator